MRHLTRNLHGNMYNQYQGSDLRVLTVCSAGLLRSPTLARYLTVNFGYNCRAVGTAEEYALIVLEPNHLVWADVVLCVDIRAEREVSTMIKNNIHESDVPVVKMLSIPDNYSYMDPLLIEILENMEVVNHEFSSLKPLGGK